MSFSLPMIRRILHGFGYLFAHALFLRAHTPQQIVRRLRIAYRLVGVTIIETPVIDGVERTIFRCPYRNLAANRYGQKWVCHDILDRVDDGYVTYLERHRDTHYQRPQSCTDLPHCEASSYCYSEVSTRE